MTWNQNNTVNEPPGGSWGGPWTEKKLEAFSKYVWSYLTIMKKFPYWETIYFDGFAGSGSKEKDTKTELYKQLEITEEEEKTYKGAAERVLTLKDDLSFNYYYFIDKNESSLLKLKNKLNEKIDLSGKRIEYKSGDANQWIAELAKVLKTGELPKGWKIIQVKDVAITIGGYAFKSGDFKNDGKYQVLRMGNVRPGVIRYAESPVFIDKIDQNVLNRSLLKINDIIITQTGTRQKRDYGFTAIINNPNLLLNQRIAAIRCHDTYLAKFFLFYSWTDSFRDQFFANETGNVGQGNVGMKAVTETLIPFCSLKEQEYIVQEIESRLSVADKMEESITQSLQQAEALRQSILKKAFEGKLI